MDASPRPRSAPILPPMTETRPGVGCDSSRRPRRAATGPADGRRTVAGTAGGPADIFPDRVSSRPHDHGRRGGRRFAHGTTSAANAFRNRTVCATSREHRKRCRPRILRSTRSKKRPVRKRSRRLEHQQKKGTGTKKKSFHKSPRPRSVDFV